MRATGPGAALRLLQRHADKSNMPSARRLAAVVGIGWSLLVPAAATAHVAAAQGEPPDSQPPSVLEAALVERACNAPSPSGAIPIEGLAQCRSAQLLSLRADFGYNLTGLSASERTKLDRACRSINSKEQREAYLDCVRAGLVSVRNQRVQENPPAPQEPAAAPPPVSAPPIDTPAPQRRTPWRSLALLIGAVLGTLLAAAAVIVRRKKRPQPMRRPCRTCDGEAVDGGDLCPSCRHQAADVLRHAAAERAEHKRTQHEEHQERARHDEDAAPK